MAMRILLISAALATYAIMGPLSVSRSTDPPKPTQSELDDGLVPPIVFDDDDEFSHDASAHFHAHGDQVCASGCAASRHPTKTLTKPEFLRFIEAVSKRPLDADNKAYESLLYYGRQSLRMLNQHGVGRLAPLVEAQLRGELERTHVFISLRVIDEHGEIRTWLEPTRVPLDRRHEFTMETNRLPQLITSGTVKRVGLDHLWTRL